LTHKYAIVISIVSALVTKQQTKQRQSITLQYYIA